MSPEEKIYTIKLAPPPPQLPIHGRDNPEEVSFIGRTNYEGALDVKKFIFGIRREDRRRHVYMVGKTGVGKSRAIELLIRQDVAHGYGLCLIDPYGDAIDAVIDFIPEERVSDVVVIDPLDQAVVPSCNPFWQVKHESRYQSAQALIEIIQKQSIPFWNPQTEYLLRWVLLALFEYPGATLQSVVHMFTEASSREDILKYVKDEVVGKFWSNEYELWRDKFGTEAVIPIINALSYVLFHPLLRNMFNQPGRDIDFASLLQAKKIVLVHLRRATIGQSGADFLGALLIARLYQATVGAGRVTAKTAQDFYLYIDEFHHFITPTFMSLFSEASRYGLCLTLAHQYLTQLSVDVRAAILGTVGTIKVFRVNGEDALRLEQEFSPIFKAKDMMNLGRNEFYIKMLVAGEASDPFSAEELKIFPPPYSSRRNEVISSSREYLSRQNSLQV